LISSYPSFLSENKNRPFPFCEHNETNLLPNSCFMDFRGWSRLKHVDKPKLTLIYSGAPGSTPPATYSSNFLIIPDHVHLFFELHDSTSGNVVDKSICIYIPRSNTTWPFVATANNYIIGVNGKIKIFEVRCLVSETILNIFSSSDIIVFSNGGLEIEPSLYLSCGGVAVDQLNIKDQFGNIKRVINGKINFLPGLNTESKIIDSKIFIDASPGFGNGNDIYTGSSLGICNGIIYSINGSTPNDNGQIFIKGDDKVKIIDDRVNHKIILAISPISNLSDCS